MRYPFQYFVVFMIILTFSLGQAWGQSRLVKKADETFESNEFFKALKLYKKAYSKSESKTEKAYILFKEAECFRRMNNTKKAESYYSRTILKKYKDPIAVFYYATMLKANEKFADAAIQYAKYDSLVPDDKRGKIGAETCTMAALWIENPTRYVVENRKELNSRESDFAPAYASSDYDVIYFTSTRPGIHGSKINPVTGQIFSDIFETELSKKGDWSDPIPLNDTINSVNDDGTPSMGDGYNSMYFTRCKVVRGMRLGCQIYKGKRPAGDDWLSYEPLALGDDSVTFGHPSLSKDGLTLYFVSDMPGGFGGLDIYRITRKSKSSTRWSEPENLGMDINTPDNETYPYIRENGILYFSSMGHPGMGGLDIFKATLGDDDRWVVENMRYPINSAADDFAITFKGNNEEGLFSSTRKGGRGKDDIYSFVLPPMEFTLQGIIKDENSDKPIAGARIRIVGSDGTDLDFNTLEDGTFRYKLNPHTHYVYIAKKEGYLTGRGKLSTAELADSKVFTDEVRLSPIGNPVEVQNALYDFGKWDLREETKRELNELVEILNTNPNITIELGSHTDMVGDSLSNITLSQKRAQAVVDYLVQKGIEADRLTAKGYGESTPKVINGKLAKQFPFKEGTVLNEAFINSLESDEQKEIANQINRRTEFKVLSTNYIPDFE